MDTLWAHYLVDKFDEGLVKGELNNWKNRARQMQNDYSVLHRDWHYRGMAAIAWREVARDLYQNYYKKMVKPNSQVDLTLMVKNQLAGAYKEYPYDPREAPTVR